MKLTILAFDEFGLSSSTRDGRVLTWVADHAASELRARTVSAPVRISWADAVDIACAVLDVPAEPQDKVLPRWVEDPVLEGDVVLLGSAPSSELYGALR